MRGTERRSGQTILKSSDRVQRDAAAHGLKAATVLKRIELSWRGGYDYSDFSKSCGTAFFRLTDCFLFA
jgi:hypothetical protein